MCRVLGLFVDVEAVRTMMSRVDGVRVASTAAHDPAGTPSTLRVPPFSTRHRRFAGMGKVPNYFKSAQKELLSLGGKLIDKMKDYDKDNIPTKVRSRRFEVLRRLHFTDATRGHRTMPWVVF